MRISVGHHAMDRDHDNWRIVLFKGDLLGIEDSLVLALGNIVDVKHARQVMHKLTAAVNRGLRGNRTRFRMQ